MPEPRRKTDEPREGERERDRILTQVCWRPGRLWLWFEPDYHVFKDAASDVCELYRGQDKPAAVVRACWCSQRRCFSHTSLSPAVDWLLLCRRTERRRDSRTKSRCKNQQLLLRDQRSNKRPFLTGRRSRCLTDSWQPGPTRTLRWAVRIRVHVEPAFIRHDHSQSECLLMLLWTNEFLYWCVAAGRDTTNSQMLCLWSGHRQLDI